MADISDIEHALVDFFEAEGADVDTEKLTIEVRNASLASTVGELLGAGLEEISLKKLAEILSEL